ncbi:restriction endonuclease subunit S [Salmonella enterica subsp. enterica serovar Poona]|nr:restriction endonuclease subunit S [Salmonella enterica subsp. enterica serovar Poona]EDP9160979.1 restriction endonuclease subunit S [Salmonella enterica subsp. enterica serovar Poona]
MLEIRTENLLDREVKDMNNWVTAQLSDFIQFKNGRKRPAERGKIPVYGGNGILDYTDTANQENSVIIGRVGAYCGSVYYEPAKHWVSDNAISAASKCTSDIVYDYYLLKSLNLNHRHIGTSQPLLTQEILNSIVVNLPPLDEQIEIGRTLRLLDEKIVNNTAINHHLEQMAQAIFKSWFVDFEPFGGEMPNDWQKGMLGDYCSVKSGFAFKSSWWQESGIRVIKIKNITDNGFNFTGCSCVSEDKIIYAKDFTTTAGDLLIAMTGATIGKFAIIPQHNEILLINQRVGKFFLGTNPLMKLPFLWCLLRQDEVFNEIVNRGQGSAQPNISPTDIMTISIILPSEGALLNFNDSLRSCFETMIANSAENQKLADLRDTLLPRLMSGELSVADLGDAK